MVYIEVWIWFADTPYPLESHDPGVDAAHDLLSKHVDAVLEVEVVEVG
jgi:hypothetical protein